MPCQYSTIRVKQRIRDRRRQAKKQNRKNKSQEIAKNKKALIFAMTLLGFDVTMDSLANDQVLIIGTKEE